MAKKRKKRGSDVAATPSMGSSESIGTDIASAENGFIVNVSGQTGGKNSTYFSKRYIAATRPEARQIAASHLSGAMKRGGKKSTKKRMALK